MDHPQANYFSKTREAFSDGIFAIIVTLLVLEISVPEIKDHQSGRSIGKSVITIITKSPELDRKFSYRVRDLGESSPHYAATKNNYTWFVLAQCQSIAMVFIHSISNSIDG